MTLIYREIDWDQAAEGCAAIDRVFIAARGRLVGSFLPRFRERFEQMRHLEAPQTGFSPLMLYTLYAAAASGPAKSVVACGCYFGIAILALATGAIDNGGGGHVIAAEDDPVASDAARRNLKRLGLDERVTIVTGASLPFLHELDSPIDLLFIDVDDPIHGKADYPDLATAAHDRMSSGALLLAHDACVERCRDDINKLRGVLSATRQYRGPWVLPVDCAGMLLAVKGCGT